MRHVALPSAATLLLAHSCMAQQGWLLDAERAVLRPSTPGARFTLSAFHDETDWATAGARLLLLCSDGGETIREPVYHGPPEAPPMVRIAGGFSLIWGQVHFPPPIIADPTSPKLAFSGRLAPLDFTPRKISLSTETTPPFLVYPDRESKDSEARNPIEASITVTVTCDADCDADLELTFYDFLCFQNAFAAGDPYADCNASGAFDLLDLLCYQNSFAMGCT